MESIGHSRQPNKVSAMLSKKISNGNHGGLSAKSLYDDVYGGPPKFGVTSLSPRFEDYSEIFGSFHTARASSIPLLDLPLVDDNEVFFDVRSSAFDYAEVFGGFNGLDFAVSHEDLFYQPNVRDGVSSDEAWTPAETDSFSGESDHSGNNQGVSKGDPYWSVDGGTEFNISYHKVNGISNEDMSKGKTHITELQDVHEFTLVFDETTPFHSIDPSLEIANGIKLDMDLNTEKVRGNHLRKTMSHPPIRTSGEQTFDNDLKLHNGYSRNDSHFRETFITVSDISLRTQPSQVPPPARPPPVLDAKKGDTGEFHLNSEHVASEGAPGDSSPPFFDVEVDINSSAAASAAAMKEAMHRAEAKLRSAKELKERKKEGFESRVKSSNDVKNNEGKINENITRSSSLKDERMLGTSDRRHSKMKISVADEKQKASKVALETPASSEGERLLHLSEKSAEEKHVNESRSSQGSDRSTGACTWKEATEFFELVGTEESPNVFQPVNHSKSLARDVRIHDHGWKANLQEESKRVKAVEQNCLIEECKKKSKETKETYEQDKNIRSSKASHEECRQREYVKKEKVAKISEQEENENTRMVHQYKKIEKKITEADQSGNLKTMSQTQHKEIKKMEGDKSKEVDRLDEVYQVMKLKENEQKLKEAEKQRESVERHKKSEKVKEREKREGGALNLGQAEGEEKLAKSVELEENDGRLGEAVSEDKTEGKESCRREDEKRLKQAEQIQNKKELKEALQGEKNEKSLKDASGIEGDKGPKQALEKEKSEKRVKEAVELEGPFEKGENDKRVKEVYERNQNKKIFKDACDGYEIENRLRAEGDIKGVQKVLNQVQKQDMNTGILKEAQRKEKTESRLNQEFNREGSGIMSNEDSHQGHSEKVLEGDAGKEQDKGLDKALGQIEGNEDGKKLKFNGETCGIWKTECDSNLLAPQLASIHEENIGKLEESQESLAGQEIGKTRDECKVGEEKLEEVGMENPTANKNIRAPEMTAGDVDHSGTQSGNVDDSVANDHEVGFGSEQTGIEKTKTVSQLDNDPRNRERKFAYEWGERGKNKQHVKIALNREECKIQALSSNANLCDNNRSNAEAEPTTVQEAVNAQKTAQQFHACQPTERKQKNLNETIASEEKDERMKRERDLEKERLRKIEEERQIEREREKDRIAVDKAMLEAEREREREKDRMAVDRATLEARDRAYAEARDRAERAAFERATAEARQRALAEARERLEKACAEARDKSFADKATTEARLKSERAAVERATAEARERAMEKAKVERAAFESRERLERSVSDKFSAFRNSGRQGSLSSDMQDAQFQNFSSSASSRHPYSSVHGACSFSERSEGGEGESAQRYRARLERYRRTAERAAKALAEKNMRDLLAQKEQAERNRLAETLDAEVRRWSSGKEGNLRALLSTLQYILGPDSGWQPIPLTEVITSAAVKKAYRKATLCVHPDKLQQRGASIQHKYICEKVFDLLKEAWNKFNSEER